MMKESIKKEIVTMLQAIGVFASLMGVIFVSTNYPRIALVVIAVTLAMASIGCFYNLIKLYKE